MTVLRISIHAPFWGAICETIYISLHISISIHAPMWVRFVVPSLSDMVCHCNPRILVGCDNLTSKGGSPFCPFQSTHPFWVRLTISRRFRSEVLFQSTRPCGVRPIKVQEVFVFRTNFNPRARVGYDGRLLLHLLVHKYFNPRARVGYDRASLPRLWPHWFSRGSKYPTVVIESR